jgi:hypothetical protein
MLGNNDGSIETQSAVQALLQTGIFFCANITSNVCIMRESSQQGGHRRVLVNKHDFREIGRFNSDPIGENNT